MDKLIVAFVISMAIFFSGCGLLEQFQRNQNAVAAQEILNVRLAEKAKEHSQEGDLKQAKVENIRLRWKEEKLKGELKATQNQIEEEKQAKLKAEKEEQDKQVTIKVAQERKIEISNLSKSQKAMILKGISCQVPKAMFSIYETKSEMWEAIKQIIILRNARKSLGIKNNAEQDRSRRHLAQLQKSLRPKLAYISQIDNKQLEQFPDSLIDEVQEEQNEEAIETKRQEWQFQCNQECLDTCGQEENE